MDIPFVYGKIADGMNFTDREEDSKKLKNNLLGLVNTIIISPRRWGKTSLVCHVLEDIKHDRDYLICKVDIFNCRTEAQFYQTYVNAILRDSNGNCARIGRCTTGWGIVCLEASATCFSTSSATMRCRSINSAT